VAPEGPPPHRRCYIASPILRGTHPRSTRAQRTCGHSPWGESASLSARQPANCTHETDGTGEGECRRVSESVTAQPTSAFRRVSLSGDADADRRGRANSHHAKQRCRQLTGCVTCIRVRTALCAPTCSPTCSTRSEHAAVRTVNGECTSLRPSIHRVVCRATHSEESERFQVCGGWSFTRIMPPPHKTMAAMSVGRVVSLTSAPDVRSARQGSIVRYVASTRLSGAQSLDANRLRKLAGCSLHGG
jgi:hypothetical protein